ncbi:4Fe-4S cluster-binding domain-containing protein [Kribbella qitaiheensis]|uniref:4Fe-4S cluster-binding domain-containing protein n=1 Tax=Kribbella qitaiheensis TaxID=1544730 RepID=UPI003620E8BD
MSIPFFVSRLVHPVHALGPGSRAGIWTQGCGIGCPGCVAQDTWGRPAGSRSDVDAVLAWLAALPWPELDGVTISGGEPTDQPEALQALLAGVGELKADFGQVDILLYTGRSAEWVLSDGRPIVDGADAVMADPFVGAEAGWLPLRGSDNQRLLALTRLGSARYLDSPLPDRRKVQVDVVDGEVRMIGIPTPGALTKLTEQAEAAGLHLRGTSWRR